VDPRRTLLLHGLALGLALTLGACADPLIEPDCRDKLKAVVKGSIRGFDIDIESLALTGGLSNERMFINFRSPLADDSEFAGNWLLDFGYNPIPPLADRPDVPSHGVQDPNLLLALTRSKDVLGSDFALASKDRGQACLTGGERGTICSGFGVDTSEDGLIDLSTDSERYHRTLRGDLTFVELTSSVIHAEFSMTFDHDIEEATVPDGELRGCFRARKRLGSQSVHELN